MLASRLPGVRTFTMNWPAPGPDGGKPSYHFIATLYWDSAEEFQAGAGRHPRAKRRWPTCPTSQARASTS